MNKIVQSIEEWLKLPEPAFPTLKTTDEKGTVYAVRKVGFLGVPPEECKKNGLEVPLSPLGKCLLPTAVVEFDGSPQLCRLPVGLGPWALFVVNTAHNGTNLFPSKVEFGVIGGRT